MKKTVATKYTSDCGNFSIEVTPGGSVSLNTSEFMPVDRTLEFHKFLGEVLLDLGEEPAVVKKPEPIVEKAELKRQFVADDTGIF